MGMFFIRIPDKPSRRSAQDDGFAGVLMKNIPIRLTLMGLASGLSSARPVQIRFEKLLGSATNLYGTVALSFVIPRSEAEGSAVPRTSPGNAEYYAQTELSSPEHQTAPMNAIGASLITHS
jgi:hypothetical protein